MNCGPGPAVCKEDFIGGEKAHALLKILEVHIIKDLRRVWIHVNSDPGVHILRAHSLKLGRI